MFHTIFVCILYRDSFQYSLVWSFSPIHFMELPSSDHFISFSKKKKYGEKISNYNYNLFIKKNKNTEIKRRQLNHCAKT